MTSLPNTPQVTQSYLDEYSGNVLIGVCSTFIALETIFLALRFYARTLIQGEWRWEELLLPFAWLVNVGLCSLCINAVPAAGVGRHLAAVVETDPSKIVLWGKSLVALEWLYLTSNPLPKIYVLSVYLRIFTQRAARITCYVLIGVIITIWFTYIIASATKYTPFAFQWDKTVQGGHCVNIEAYYQTTSAPNIITDLVILLLPIPTVIKLQASVLRKVGLLLIFIAGSIGLIGSCIRLSIFFRSNAFTDNTWESVPLMSWTCIEPGMYLIAACCLTLRPLLGKIPLNLLRTKLGSGGQSGITASFKDNAPSGSRRSGFIQMRDLPHGRRSERSESMDIMTTKSVTVDVEAATPYETESGRQHP